MEGYKEINNEDLKFIPLNIKKQFIEKNSTWVPLLDTNNLEVEKLKENFLRNFESNINNSSLEKINIGNLNYEENKKISSNEKKQEFEKNFDLEYPSETYEEELYSYNKDSCKKLNNNINTGLNNNLNNNLDNDLNNKNINAKIQNSKVYSFNDYDECKDEKKLVELDYYKEIIHMALLRDVDFNSDIKENSRSNKVFNDKIDKIFNMIKNEESITETFKVYNVPKPLFDLIIKKIIKISLENYECK